MFKVEAVPFITAHTEKGSNETVCADIPIQSFMFMYVFDTSVVWIHKSQK